MDDAISRSAMLCMMDKYIDMSFNEEKVHYAMCAVAEFVKDAPALKADGNTSDGYHTFNELYDHRAKLFSVIVRNYPDLCWKSKQHHDGTMYDGMFIVGINTPQGQASYHYDIDPYWDMFNCREMERAPEWDGHTPEDAINRIAALDAPVVHGYWIADRTNIVCSVCGTKYSDEIVFMKRGGNGAKKPKCCPECGARMDAKEG